MNSSNLRSLERTARHTLAADNFGWLTEKRWFADKGRSIRAIEFANVAVSERAGVSVLLTVVDVEFQDGGRSTYFAPLMAADRLEHCRDGEPFDETPALVDAVSQPEFGRWIADMFSSQGVREVAPEWVAHSQRNAPAHFEGQADLMAKPLAAEQSNSSIRIGSAAIVKILRRIQPGVNPEDEVLRALAGFSHLRISSYLGSLYWQAGDDQGNVVAIAQTWVPNRGDGWSWALLQLHSVGKKREVEPLAIAALHELGVRTADLHLALSVAPGEAFGNRVATADDVMQVQQAFLTSLGVARQLVSSVVEASPDVLAKDPFVAGSMSGVEALASGFSEEEGTARIRVHGDYHLGQVLRTTGDDWTIIDFEGEPARSLEERRMHSSALRDVAGMLRSFAYARAVAEQELHADDTERAVLREWELQARAAFISGYRTTLSSAPLGSGLSLVPQSESAFQSALAAWEADKALYEVAYEARNRPGWIGIPLRALMPEALDQA